jgi:hypothetical protein
MTKRRHFLKLTLDFAAGAAAFATGAQAVPLMPHPLAEDGRLPPQDEDARPAVTTGDEVETFGQQKWESATLDRLPQPLHGELDILRLELAPAIHFSLVAIFRETLEVFRGQTPGGRALLGVFLADIRVFGHRPSFPLRLQPNRRTLQALSFPSRVLSTS